METILFCKMYNLSLEIEVSLKISNIFNKATIVEIFLLVPLNEVYWCILTRTNLTSPEVFLDVFWKYAANLQKNTHMEVRFH